MCSYLDSWFALALLFVIHTYFGKGDWIIGVQNTLVPTDQSELQALIPEWPQNCGSLYSWSCAICAVSQLTLQNLFLKS